MILRSAELCLDSIASANSTQQLGQLWEAAIEKIDFTVGRETQAVDSVQQLVPEPRRATLMESLALLDQDLRRFGKGQTARVHDAIQEKARLLGIAAPVEPIVLRGPDQTLESTIIVKRKRLGSIPLDEIRPDQREGYPSGAWDVIVTTALYWCDGHRPLSEVIHLTQMELGPVNFDFVGYFRFLRKHGYVEFVKGN